MLCELTADQREENWHLVTRSRADLTGGVALAALLEALPLTRWVGVAFRVTRAVGVLDAVDRLLKRARRHLARYVPDVAGPRRFP